MCNQFDCKIIIRFSNGLIQERSIPVGRAYDIKDRPDVWVEPDSEIYELHGKNDTVLIPAEINISLNVPLIPPKVPMFEKATLYAAYDGKCAYCGHGVPYEQATIDHVLPRSQGGESVWENVVLACRPCNAKKADRTPEQADMRLRRKPHIPKARVRKATSR